MMKFGIVLMVAVVVLAMGSPCMAEDNAFTKLGRGLNNALTGWMEVPDSMVEVGRDENVFAGLTYGSVKGSAYCVARTTAGAFELGTFVFPEYDKPIMEPKHKF